MRISDWSSDVCSSDLRIICIILGAVFAFVAWLAYTSSGPAIVYWLCGVGAIVLLTAGTFGPRSLRVGLVTWLLWIYRWCGLSLRSSRSRFVQQSTWQVPLAMCFAPLRVSASPRCCTGKDQT